ncbi:MAG TPA: permease, partial [bacterium]|nr:permease [bacterium]
MSIFYSVKLLADWLTYSVFHLTPKTLLAEAVNFFIYDTIKVLILLVIIIFIISIIRSFFPP